MTQLAGDWPTVREHSPLDDPQARQPHGNGSPVNVAGWERWVSAVGGASMLVAGLATRRPVVGLLSALTGGAFLYRGATGHCPMYGALGIDTAEHKDTTAVPAQQGYKVEEAVTVNRPREELYRFWRDVSNLPRIMRHLKSVEPSDERTSRWTAHGPLDLRVQWQAEIFNERENEMIAWRSLEGGDVETAGSVHFEALPHNRGTLLRVSLKYNPPGGKVGANLATLLGSGVDAQIREDLRRFKCTMEAGEIPTVEGQSVGGKPGRFTILRHGEVGEGRYVAR